MERQIDKMAMLLWKINGLLSFIALIFIIFGIVIVPTVGTTNQLLDKIVKQQTPEAIKVITEDYILEGEK